MSRSLGWSAVVHVGITAAILVWAWLDLQPRAEIETAAVPFTLVSVARDAARAAIATAEIPQVTVILPRGEAPRRLIPQRELATEPAAPTGTGPTPSTLRGVSGPRMTIEKFREAHPQTTGPKVLPQERPLNVRRVNLDELDAIPVDASPAASAASGGADDFTSRVRQRLREAYATNGGIDCELATRVRFSLRADGTVERAKIVVSSGDALFDRAVLDAFAKLQLDRVSRERIGQPLEITFRTRLQN